MSYYLQYFDQSSVEELMHILWPWPAPAGCRPPPLTKSEWRTAGFYGPVPEVEHSGVRLGGRCHGTAAAPGVAALTEEPRPRS